MKILQFTLVLTLGLLSMSCSQGNEETKMYPSSITFENQKGSLSVEVLVNTGTANCLYDDKTMNLTLGKVLKFVENKKPFIMNFELSPSKNPGF